MSSRKFWSQSVKSALGVGLAALFMTTNIVSANARPAKQNLADSFLPVVSTSVAQLCRQVQTNPTVRRHYAKYFHVPEASVADYLRQNLVQTRLSKAGRYTMYLVRSNGLIYPVMMNLPKGTPIFTLQTNPPALLSYRDGNPIKDFVVTIIVKAPPTPGSYATVKVSRSIENQNFMPVPVHETIIKTTVGTPVYQPTSPLSASEQTPEAYSSAPTTNP